LVGFGGGQQIPYEPSGSLRTEGKPLPRAPPAAEVYGAARRARPPPPMTVRCDRARGAHRLPTGRDGRGDGPAEIVSPVHTAFQGPLSRSRVPAPRRSYPPRAPWPPSLSTRATEGRGVVVLPDDSSPVRVPVAASPAWWCACRAACTLQGRKYAGEPRGASEVEKISINPDRGVRFSRPDLLKAPIRAARRRRERVYLPDSTGSFYLKAVEEAHFTALHPTT
jgi:hypothetical protein